MPVTIDGTGTINYNIWRNTAGVKYGTVLQVQSAHLVTTFTTNATIVSGGAAVTGLSVNITPSYATSKILVMGHVVSGYTAAATQAYYKLKRNGVEVGSGTPVSNRPGVITRSYYNGNDACQTDPFFYLDSPASTSLLTYQIYACSESTSYTVFINRTNLDTDNATNGTRGASSITVMEIAQ